MSMKVKKIISSVFILFFVWSALSALSITFNSGESTRDPDHTKRRDDDLVGVIIKTNVDDAEVYINGKYFGSTPLATVDLSVTHYDVEIRKSGYDTINCRIYPRRRYTYTYEFVMQKTCGYINVKNLPAGSLLYVDGSRQSSSPIEVSPGNHTIKVRKFGYEDYSERVYVENHKTVNVSVSLKTAPFRISNFKVSKSKINPDYTSGMGKVTFSFEVTNDGAAILSVRDRYGNEVWVKEYNSFTTWEQSVTWNGKDNYGESLPDGQYTVNLYSFDFDQSQPLKIDRSLIYPLSSFTPSGTGIGTLPCAFGDGVNYTKLFVDFGPAFDLSGEKSKLAYMPVSAGIIINFWHFNEFAFSAGAVTAADSSLVSTTPFIFSVSYKRSFSVDLSSNLKFNFAGLIDYNYCSEYNFGPLASNIGSGLDLGLAAGLEGKRVYLGLTGEYSFEGTRQKPKNKAKAEPAIIEGDIIKYGAVLSVMPARNLRTGAWAALYNNKILEGGLEFIAMPGSGAFCFDAKACLLTDISSSDKNLSLNARFGLSYLF